MNEEKNIQGEQNEKPPRLIKADFKLASTPVFSEVLTRYPWVSWGESNLMPNYLLDQYNNCAIHKAVILSKLNQILGDGIVSLNNPMSVVHLVNGKENIEEIIRKCTLDFLVFGAFAVQVIWSNDRKQIAELYHMDMSRIRMGKLNENDEEECYYYSPDWTNIRKFPPVEIKAFNQKEKDPNQLYVYKCYQPNQTYYPVPDYSGAMAAIAIDVEVKNFHQNNLRRGMSPSLWINYVNGVPDIEEQRVLSRALHSQYAGSDQAGQAIISFNESKELSPEIIQIPRNDNDGYYSALYTDITQTILSGHRISSGELFGVSTAQGLTSKDDIINHAEYFRKSVIMPYQNEILPNFEKLLSLFSGVPTQLDVKPLTIFETGDIEQAPVVGSAPVNTIETPSVNENLKGLKGREWQNMMRIVREYNKEKITRGQAIQMLMSGYGLTEEECSVWLGDNE